MISQGHIQPLQRFAFTPVPDNFGSCEYDRRRVTRLVAQTD